MTIRIPSPPIANPPARPLLLLLLAVLLSPRPLGAQPASQIGLAAGAQASDELSGLSLAALERRAQAGSPAAQTELGERYEQGRSGLARSYAQAMTWYRKAAEQKDAAAEFRLARLYERGEGGPSDSEQALLWYQRSAEQGYAPAEYSLGLRYMQGLAVPKNQATARLWLQKAAEQGNADAKSLLAALAAHTGQPARAAAPAGGSGSSADPVQQALDMMTGTAAGPARTAPMAGNPVPAAQYAGTDPVQQALGMLTQPSPPTPAPVVRPAQMASNAPPAQPGMATAGGSPSVPTPAARPAPRSSAVPKEKPPVLLLPGTYQGELTGYALPPTEPLPEPAGIRDKNAVKAIRGCSTPLKRDDLITRGNLSNVCLTAAQYFQAQQDTHAAKIAYQKSCAYGNAPACIGLGNYLNSIDESKAALYVWNYGVGCNYNQQCVEAIFQYYATVSPSDAGVLDFYGHDLCINKLEDGVCKALAGAGVAIDFDAIAQQRKANEIADLKTKINALEDQAQSSDNGGAVGQAAADHVGSIPGFGGFGGFLASHAASKSAESSQKDAQTARAQAAQLRARLIQLQGNDDGAKPKGPSGLAAVITGVSAGASAASGAGANAVTVTAAGVQAGASQYNNTAQQIQQLQQQQPPPPPQEQPQAPPPQ